LTTVGRQGLTGTFLLPVNKGGGGDKGRKLQRRTFRSQGQRKKGHDSQENRVAAEKGKLRSRILGSKEICTSTGTGHGNPKTECRIPSRSLPCEAQAHGELFRLAHEARQRCATDEDRQGRIGCKARALLQSLGNGGKSGNGSSLEVTGWCSIYSREEAYGIRMKNSEAERTVLCCGYRERKLQEAHVAVE
jgi:hypothetical protein